MARESGRVVAIIAVFLLLILLVFLLVSYNTTSSVANSERFYEAASVAPTTTSDYIKNSSVASLAPADPNAAGSGSLNNTVSPVSGAGFGAGASRGAPATPAPATCYPRDRLTADDLLPRDAANSRWAQMNPAGQGDVGSQNYLTAAYHYGINTIGQTLKNANHQLRSDPPNPQTPVSPWNISTIEYDDRGGKTLEIGGAP